MDRRITPGDIVLMSAGGLCLIASFLTFYDFPREAFIGDKTAWGSGLFPVATLIPLLVIAAAVLVVLVKVASMNYPPNGILGMGLPAVLLVLAVFAALLAIAYLIIDPGYGVEGIDVDRGIGFFGLLIGAVAAVVGAILTMSDRSSTGQI